MIVLSDNDAEDHDGVDEGEGPDEGEGDGIEGANEDPDDGGPFDESGDGDGESYEMSYEPVSWDWMAGTWEIAMNIWVLKRA